MKISKKKLKSLFKKKMKKFKKLRKKYPIYRAGVAMALIVSLTSTTLLAWSLQSDKAFASPGHDHGDEISGAESKYPIVTVEQAKSPAETNLVIEAAGEILSIQESDVYPLRDGIVQSLSVNVGDKVQKGQVLGYLYPDVEQTILSAELNLAQVQREAAEKRRTFVDALQGPQKEQLIKSLNYAKKNIDLAERSTEQTLSKIDTEAEVAESALDVAQLQYEAELQRLESEINNAYLRMNQQRVSALNAVSDVIVATEQLMYTRPGAITNGVARGNTSIRRNGVYQTNSRNFRQIEKELLTFYKEYQAFQTKSVGDQVEDVEAVQEWLNRTLEIAKEVRLLANKTTDISSSAAEVMDLRTDVDEAVDHLVELSQDIIDSTTSINTARTEKITLEADLQQKITDLEGQIQTLGKEKTRSSVSQEGVVIEKKSTVDDIQTQLKILDKTFEQQRMESDLSIVLNRAQENSIRQKMGAARAIKAPFSGTISRRFVNEGASVGMDRPVFHLVNDDEKYVRFFVSEADLPFVIEGQKVIFSSPHSSTLSSESTITRIAPALDQDTRTVLVEAEIPKNETTDRFLANMSVRVQIPIQTDETLKVVPEVALNSTDSHNVWIINDELTVESFPVNVRFIRDGFAYLEEGLDQEWVIVKSPVELYEGLEVDTAQ